MYSLMKSSSHRSFFMETAERPSRSTLTSHSSTTPLKLLDAATAAAIFSSLICPAESFPFARTLCASSRALLARVDKGGIRIDAERQHLMLAVVAVVHAPVAPIIGGNIKKQPVAVGELIGFFPALGARFSIQR